MQTKIDYSWDKDTLDDELERLPTRHNIQLTRRLFHMACGSVIATLYWLSFSHTEMIRFLGTIACVLYVVEQIRINYPEAAEKFTPFTKFIMRAEEQLKESAMVPYVFAVLLCIITFPKEIALIAIYTLAISDPLSAIVGITFGKRRIVSHKSLEGSAAFFISCFIVCYIVLSSFLYVDQGMVLLMALLLSFSTSAFEMVPFRIDDNLTIPLFVSFMGWALFWIFGLPL